MNNLYQINYGNGYVTVSNPRNSGIKSELIWASITPSFTLQGTSFEWIGGTAHDIYDYTIEHGIYEGLPLKIINCDINQSIELLLDLANPATLLDCDIVVCTVIDKGKTDWFNEAAASFSFSYLASTDSLATCAVGFTPLTHNDYKRTPYCISEIPDYTTVASLSISLFLIGYEIEQKVEDLGRHTTKFIGDVMTAITIIGIEEIIRVALDAVRIILDIIVIYKLIQYFIDLLKELFDAIIQSKKIKFCMRDKDLFEKACSYIGVTFSSTIFAPGSQFENATTMPKKIVQPADNTGINFDRNFNEDDTYGNSYGYFDGTFKEFIDAMEIKYNAKGVLNNGVYYFRERHGYNSPGSYSLPNTGEVGYTFNLPKPYGTNASELPFNYTLRFQIDQTEANTYHKYKGTTCQYQIERINVNDKKNLLKTGGVIVDIPFALGKRKEYLTRPEAWLVKHRGGIVSMIQAILPVASQLKDMIIGTTFGAAGAAAGAIFDLYGEPDYVIPELNLDRIGWLLLSDDAFSIPKTFIGTPVMFKGEEEWHLDANTEAVMSAVNLMDKCHKYNLATHGAQRKKYKGKVPFCCTEYNQVINNNVFPVPGNTTAEFRHIVWDQDTETAETEYDVKENFDNFLTEKIIIDGN